MKLTRRIALQSVGATTIALATGSASAEVNDDFLGCSLLIGEAPVHFDDSISMEAVLTARRRCSVYYPLSWGYAWGLRLKLRDEKGQMSDPHFHMNFERPGPGSMAAAKNYRELQPGQTVGLKDKIAAHNLFPSRGTFKLRLGYVPEPTKGFTPLSDTVVMEDGSITSPWYPVTVV